MNFFEHLKAAEARRLEWQREQTLVCGVLFGAAAIMVAALRLVL